MVFPLSQHLFLSLGFSGGVYDSPQDYWLYFLEGKLSDEKCSYSLWNKSKWEKIITEVSWDKSAFFNSKTEENIYFFSYPLNQYCVPWASAHMKLPWLPVNPGGLILVIQGLGSGIDFWSVGHFCIIHVNGISACVSVNPATVPKKIPSCVFGIKMFWRESYIFAGVHILLLKKKGWEHVYTRMKKAAIKPQWSVPGLNHCKVPLINTASLETKGAPR